MTLHLSSSPTSSSLVSVVRTTESTKESCSGVKCSGSSLGLWCLLNMSYPLVTTLWNWVSVYGTCKSVAFSGVLLRCLFSYPHTLPLSQNGLHCLLSIQGRFSAIPQPGYAQMHSNPDCLLCGKRHFYLLCVHTIPTCKVYQPQDSIWEKGPLWREWTLIWQYHEETSILSFKMTHEGLLKWWMDLEHLRFFNSWPSGPLCHYPTTLG